MVVAWYPDEAWRRMAQGGLVARVEMVSLEAEPGEALQGGWEFSPSELVLNAQSLMCETRTYFQ